MRRIAAVGIAAVVALAAALILSPIGQAGIAKPCPHGYVKVHGRCVKVKPKPKPNPMLAWSPKVERFYQHELANLENLQMVSANFGHLQSGQLADAYNRFILCEATLATDTTPAIPAAQAAMTNLHSVCTLFTKAGYELQTGYATADISQIAAAKADLGAGFSLLRSVVTSLGQPI